MLNFLGPYLHSLEVSKLKKCAPEIKHDHSTFGIDCVKSLLDFQMVAVEHETDITRLKKQAAKAAHVHKDWLATGKPDHSDHLLVYNATLLTMDTDNVEVDLIRNGSMLISGGVIRRVGAGHSFNNLVPGIKSLDANGGK